MIHRLTVSILLVGVTASCSSQVGSSEHTVGASTEIASEDVAATQSKPSAARLWPKNLPPGGEVLLVVALRELDLSAAQRVAINGALSQVQSEGTPPHASDLVGLAALAAGVRAGRVDVEEVRSKLAPVNLDLEGHVLASASALQTLHDTLTSSQRSALVDAVTKEVQGPPPDPATLRACGPLSSLLASLDLSEVQKTALDTAFRAQFSPGTAGDMRARFEANRAEMASRLQTFAADAFSAVVLAAPPVSMAKGDAPPHQLVSDVALVTSVLRPDQRQKLASALERGSAFGAPPGGSCSSTSL